MPENEKNRLQEEAIRRAREMHSRARFPPRQQEQEREASPEPKAAEPVHREQSGISAPAAAELPGGLLENLFQDKERTIILALLILLSGEDGNHELMFALLFLLM